MVSSVRAGGVLKLRHVGGAAYLDNLLALVRVIDCVKAETDLKGCIEVNAWEHALGISVLALGSLFLLPWIGVWFSRLVRNSLARSAMERFEADLKTPDAGSAILFLRLASDDSVVLPPAEWRLIRNALSPSVWLSGHLDDLLVAEGMVYGVPVGLGKDEEVSFGAMRLSAANEPDLPIEKRG